MKKLILIRHGETDYTTQRKYCGHENIPLNAQGIKQAKRLRSRLKNIQIDAIYSSDLLRAFETAKLVFPDMQVTRTEKLREINFGEFSGLTFADVESKYPGTYKAWIENPESVKIPNGESLPDLARRVDRFFERITKDNLKGNVAIISHGGPIRILLLGLQRRGLDKFWEIEQRTTAINIIDFDKGVPKFLKINDTSHLEC
ncbi:MAG: alpha-ribazole phosphatase [Candidatus Omnitrophica bacterium]|nr:alpha-ribazole phosphatase [Candidatus Omnitrophota bacterium]